ncbi:SCO family protein [Myxococcus sp. RHSTA-1-4]|uniref:SCO family protein n=1 Tax=Myxococcus sp. RHSTA-1-4 TaxID=2874601 RepID=UPI00351D9765
MHVDFPSFSSALPVGTAPPGAAPWLPDAGELKACEPPEAIRTRAGSTLHGRKSFWARQPPSWGATAPPGLPALGAAVRRPPPSVTSGSHDRRIHAPGPPGPPHPAPRLLGRPRRVHARHGHRLRSHPAARPERAAAPARSPSGVHLHAPRRPALRQRAAPGRPYIANFIFTRCPTVRPAFTRKMAGVRERTASFGTGLQLVSFSVWGWTSPGPSTTAFGLPEAAE